MITAKKGTSLDDDATSETVFAYDDLSRLPKQSDSQGIQATAPGHNATRHHPRRTQPSATSNQRDRAAASQRLPAQRHLRCPRRQRSSAKHSILRNSKSLPNKVRRRHPPRTKSRPQLPPNHRPIPGRNLLTAHPRRRMSLRCGTGFQPVGERLARVVLEGRSRMGVVMLR